MWDSYLLNTIHLSCERKNMRSLIFNVCRTGPFTRIRNTENSCFCLKLILLLKKKKIEGTLKPCLSSALQNT